MAEETTVAFVERWQTGAALLLASALAGGILAAVLGNADVPYGAFVGLVGGAVACFLALSYLLYGR
ncbi:uncharacterized protein HHUB_2832 [Halobacterium hubeiense]|uniref:DUF8144 domain-containing protein n=1 Tax=Halobacterium hubeiense TaxID=1407499 RepID=A0A0U5H367_9EURY|nr:hypothetical protein [Halobacterium hubeiense]CQH58806.1 uncharacterized protein HHUB_2832 [Halobacterium hubeiense]